VAGRYEKGHRTCFWCTTGKRAMSRPMHQIRSSLVHLYLGLSISFLGFVPFLFSVPLGRPFLVPFFFCSLTFTCLFLLRDLPISTASFPAIAFSSSPPFSSPSTSSSSCSSSTPWSSASGPPPSDNHAESKP
jgi:hypothetical protein